VGTPVAQEDDAERAVRAALDLVAAVPELDPKLQARAGVLTGEAAVNLAAEGEGMVAGDLVNTASRLQSAAEPGTVLVGESTKRATDAAVLYEDAGLHELKGKAEPVLLFRALRVTAGRAGALKSDALEPPFVGRARELRLVKELFHASAEEGKAHLVNVIGIAGIGKSRLAWEFEKYIDGLVDTIWWWRGRCLAYGEGVAYWALAEMVRTRANIIEGEDPATARGKLAEALAAYIADGEERAWIEPRLAHLLGLAEGSTHERDDLFAAWRLYFERLSEHQPAVLVFEDVQWADVSLLEFVEYLLEWSRNHPIFVLALARPELYDRHPDFGKSIRNAATLSLEPLPAGAMDELLDGFVPGLPEELRRQILLRAEGVPLYAVETVRMLLDRGLLMREGDVYRPTGSIEALDVPETLQALIAARLDGLTSSERRLVQDACVLGKTFAKAALSDLSGLAEPELEPLLSSLLRKEVLTLQADPRSPERGQYGFVQDLLKRVAYETLSKRECKARHLGAAGYLERSWGPAEQEIVEIVASHYLSAYEAVPDAEDAAEIKAKARAMLKRAGERAASLAAAEEAQRYFARAAGLADDPLEEASLRERAGMTAWIAGDAESARNELERALALFESSGETHPAARVSARLGEVEWQAGELDAALARMEEAFAVLSDEEPDEDFATLAAQLGRLYFFKGDLALAKQRLEVALAVAESFWLPGLLADALVSEANVADGEGRPEKALALTRHGLELALEHDQTSAALRAYMNLADLLRGRDRYEEALESFERGIALAHKAGDRVYGDVLRGERDYSLAMTGHWDEALASMGEVTDMSGLVGMGRLNLVQVQVSRGALLEARRLIALGEHYEGSADWQERTGYAAARASVLVAEGDYAGALAAAEEALGAIEVIGAVSQPVKSGFVDGIEAALALGDLAKAQELKARIDELKPGVQPPFLRAHSARFGARIAALEGRVDAVEPGFKTAAAAFREYGIVFWLAVTLLEYGEWLTAQSRPEDAEPLIAEARDIFERLGATPWLERVATALGGATLVA
jgi:tetratricopeptide (TPR) repeat protein